MAIFNGGFTTATRMRWAKRRSRRERHAPSRSLVPPERQFFDSFPATIGETAAPQASSTVIPSSTVVCDKHEPNWEAARQRSSNTSARLSPELALAGAASTWILSEGIPAFDKAAATACARSRAVR